MATIRNESRFAIPVVIATVAAAIGVADLPYGYYVLLRVVFFGVSVLILLEAKFELRDWQKWLLVGSAILHNPFFPVRLGDKGLWIVLNFATVILYWIVEMETSRPPRLTTQITPRPQSLRQTPSQAEIDRLFPPRDKGALLESTWVCRHCDHEWVGPGLQLPVQCPSCGSDFIHHARVSEVTKSLGPDRESLGPVLVVEDDAAVLRPLVKFLQMRKYAVVTAETTAAALDAVVKYNVRAAIVDLRLRTTSGAMASGRELTLSLPKNIPVILFSGLRSESEELETIRPLTRVLHHPYSLHTLVEQLEDILEEAKQRVTE